MKFNRLLQPSTSPINSLMKIFSLLVLLISLFDLSYGQISELPTIHSVENKIAENLVEIIDGELWGYHSTPIGAPSASSTLKSQNSNSYDIENIHDIDLTTAWVDGDESYGIGESFEFKIRYSDSEHFGSPYNFYGIIQIFNGYCKSERHWIENSRVKTLKMSLNEQAICFIELVDTWQYQSVDVRKFFREPNWFPNAPFQIENNDVVRFEIIDIYKGSKYKDTTISEFIADSPPN